MYIEPSYRYTPVEFIEESVIEVRRCRVCHQRVQHDSEAVMGRLPEYCRTNHGNQTERIKYMLAPLPGFLARQLDSLPTMD